MYKPTKTCLYLSWSIHDAMMYEEGLCYMEIDFLRPLLYYHICGTTHTYVRILIVVLNKWYSKFLFFKTCSFLTYCN